MRTHGWGGSFPASDDEARERILDAAQDGIQQAGRNLKISDVAKSLGITRVTVYRYFASTEELILASAIRATGPFMDRVTRRLAGVTEPGDAVIKGMVQVIRELPENPFLAVTLYREGGQSNLHSVTAPLAQDFGVGLLKSLDVDWAGCGFDDKLLRELVEHMLRVAQSFLGEDPTARRSAARLERYLDRWMRPAINQIVNDGVSSGR